MPWDLSEAYNFPLGSRRPNLRRALAALMGGGAAAFDPLSLSPALWLKADAGLYQSAGGSAATADGDPVGQWQDQSGNARHAAQATVSKKPTLKLNVLNGLPGILWDGTDDCLQVSSLPLGAFTVFLVFKLSGTAGIIVEHSADTNANDGHYLYGSTGLTMKIRRSAVISDKDYAINWAVDNAAKLVTHSYGGTHATNLLRINRAAVSVTSGAATGDPGTGTATATLNLGSRNNGASLPTTGHFFELLAYGSLSASQIEQVEAYLQERWGTP